MAQPRENIRGLFVPEVFNQYFIEENVNVNKLITSGIVQHDPELDALATSGGRVISMPYFKTLTGEDDVLGIDKNVSVATMASGVDMARLHLRGKAWKVSDLEKSLSGSDPMKALTSMVGKYFAEREQDMLLATLEGVFKSDDMKGNTYIAGGGDRDDQAQIIDAKEFIMAKTKLGDNADKLTAVMMHSDTFAELETQNLIQYIPNSQGVVDFPTYLGKKVIVDDKCPKSLDGVYTTYLFGEGAIGRGEGRPEVPSEIGRNHLQGHDELVVRRHFILHPRGVKFNSAHCDGEAPTNAELKQEANWTRVYDPKAIRIVAFKHKLV